MGVKKTIVRNVFSNWAGLAVNMIAGFFLMRFLIQHLGESTYGFWLVIGSVTGYFGLFDIGIRSSVGRYLAYYRGKNDVQGANRSLSTGFTILCAAGCLVILATLVFLPLFGPFFRIPAEELRAVQLALFISGLNLALTFPLGIFDGTLWAAERFDLINVVDILATLARFIAAILLVLAGQGLVALALIALATMLLANGTKYILSHRVIPGLRVSFALFHLAYLKELFFFGAWNFISGIAGRIIYYTSNIIIGRVISAAAVTLFAPAMQLTMYALELLRGITGVFTPFITGLHARSETTRQKEVFLRGTRICLAFAFFFLTGALFLGKDLIMIWLRLPSFEASYPVLVVLAFGTFFSMVMGMGSPVIQSMAKNKYTAWLASLEAVLNITLSILLVRPLGILGVAFGISAPKLITAGLIYPWIVCRLLGISWREYLLGTVAPLAIYSAPAMLLGYVLGLHETRNLLIWLVKAGVLGLGFGLVFWRGSLSSLERGWAGQWLRRKLGFAE